VPWRIRAIKHATDKQHEVLADFAAHILEHTAEIITAAEALVDRTGTRLDEFLLAKELGVVTVMFAATARNIRMED